MCESECEHAFEFLRSLADAREEWTEGANECMRIVKRDLFFCRFCLTYAVKQSSYLGENL